MGGILREAQLMPALSSGLSREFNFNLETAYELNSGFGIADLVLFKLDNDELQRRRTKQIDPITSYELLRTLTSLNQYTGEVISLTSLKEMVGGSNKKEIISYLIEKHFISSPAENECEVLNGYKVGIKEIIAVEAKLSNWKRGLYQAYRYKAYSNQSYLAIYSKYIRPALSSIEEFKKANVGLIEVCNKDIVLHYSPERKEIDENVFSALAYEELFARKNSLPII